VPPADLPPDAASARPQGTHPAYPHDAPLPLPGEQWRALCDAYADPPRAYHHIGHVFDTLAGFREVADAPGWRRPAEVWAALLYHDAIHVAGRKDNERRSADLALAHFRRWPVQPGGIGASEAGPHVTFGASADDAIASATDAARDTERAVPSAAFAPRRVAELIALTARHGTLDRSAVAGAIADPADLDDTLHMLDIDMAILGAEPAVFAAYDRAIAEEYRGRVPGFLYRRGRRAFFRGLLARERIYLSDVFHERCEAQARSNLQATLQRR